MSPTTAACPRDIELFVLDQVAVRGWERLLWIESGDGWAPEEAWRRMGRRGYVCGIDRSQAGTDEANRLRAVQGTLEFRTWAGQVLPFPDQCFDDVIAAFAPGCNPTQYLPEVRRVLAPAGRIHLLEWDRNDHPAGVTAPLEQAGFISARTIARYGRATVVAAVRAPAPK